MINLEYTNPLDNLKIEVSVEYLNDAFELQENLRNTSRRFSETPEIFIIDYPFEEGLKETISLSKLRGLLSNSFNPTALKDYIEMLKVGRVSEEDFWKAIELMNWPSDHCYDRIASELDSELYGNRGKACALADMFYSLRDKLYEEIDNKIFDKNLIYDEVIGLGDNGFSDLLANIIGMGKETYERALKDPVFAGQQGTYESFAYSFNNFAL